MVKLSVKLCSLLLFITIAVSLFVGCSAAKSSKQSTSALSSAVQTQTEETNKQVPEKIKLNFYTMNWFPKDMPDNNLVKAEIEKRIADTINIELNFVEIPGAEYWNKLNVAIASGEQIDAFAEGMNGAANWGGKTDFVQDIGPLVDKYGQNLKKYVEQIAWDSIKFNGKIIGIPNHLQAALCGIIVRKDILDKYGIPLPTTLEEMEKACAALKAADPNIIPSMGQWWMMEVMVAPVLGKQYSGSYVIDETNQKITLGYFTEEVIPFINLLKKWKENGWYDKDHLVNQGKPEVDKNAFASGKTVFVWGNIGLLDPYATAAQKVDPKAEIEYIPSFGPNHTVWSFSGPANMCVIIPKMCKAPERVVQYFDWIVSSPENYTLVSTGIEGKHFKYVDSNRQKMIQPLQTEDLKTYNGMFLCTLSFDNVGYDTYVDDPNDPNVKKNYELYIKYRNILRNTKWKTDPLIGKVSLDKSIETKYPLLSSMINDWFVGKFLTGQLPPTKENIQKMIDAYNKAGGEEVSREYYRQYKAAGN